MDFEFIYGDETVEVIGSIGYSGDEGNYDTPPYYEAIYDPNDLEIIVSGEYEYYQVQWAKLAQEFKDEIVRQIEKRL
tara:strand:+ start:236 stop:466 length:231 start_codon:yes stop_codon:yes gene_type:complete